MSIQSEIMEKVSKDMNITPKDDEWDEVLDNICNWDDAEIEMFSILSETYGYEECYDIIDNGYYTIWYDCKDMADVAETYLTECGYLNGLPYFVIDNINYEAIGYDMELEGNYITCSDYVIEVNY